MNKLLRLTLTLFMWFNVLYADIEDLKLSKATEYSYYGNGELSVKRVYDRDGILKQTVFYYYQNGRLATAEISSNNGDKLIAHEYKNGKLVKDYEAKKIWKYLNGRNTLKYEAVGFFRNEYEYDRYGRLVYIYEYIEDPFEKVLYGRSVAMLTKTKYEYDSSGKTTWISIQQNNNDFKQIKCGYDSDGKLIEEQIADIMVIKYKYDENRLYSTNVFSNDVRIGKIEYEYNPAGQLIRKYEFGEVFPAMCRVPEAFRNNDVVGFTR